MQQGLEHIAGFDASTMKFRANTVELYFETEDFGGFMQLLDSYPQVERLHEPKTFSWLQRGIHIFDPDGHLIEVSESMYSVACKQFKEGKAIEETAKLVPPLLDNCSFIFSLERGCFKAFCTIPPSISTLAPFAVIVRRALDPA